MSCIPIPALKDGSEGYSFIRKHHTSKRWITEDAVINLVIMAASEGTDNSRMEGARHLQLKQLEKPELKKKKIVST